MKAWLSHHAYTSAAVYWKCHASVRLPVHPSDVILRRSFTSIRRPGNEASMSGELVLKFRKIKTVY